MRAWSARLPPPRKLVSAGAVVLLHLLVLALWLAPRPAARHRPEPRETILYLPPLTKPEPPKPVAPPPRESRPIVRLPPLPGSRAITIPLSKDNTAPALPGLGRSLFGCRPENFANLSPEDQAACASASNGPKPPGAPDFRDHSDHVPGAALWARQKARKNGPLLLPCASTQSIFATLSTATLACLAKGAVNGMDVDAQPMYGDKPEDTHLPNNGDPRPTYVDPDH
jgi:hypothetical protein